MPANGRWDLIRRLKVKARSCNHCCCGKAVSNIYSACVVVALGIHHAMYMRHIVICGLHGTATFFHIIF